MSGLLLRPIAEGETAEALGVLLAARVSAAEHGTMPPIPHPLDSAPSWFAEVVASREVWVAERDGCLVGVIVLDAAFLDQLHVRPDAQHQGIGTALLELAKAVRPQGFDLWVFEVNEPAIALYERNGMVVMERTDGAVNDERAPDRRYRWSGRRGRRND